MLDHAAFDGNVEGSWRKGSIGRVYVGGGRSGSGGGKRVFSVLN